MNGLKIQWGIYDAGSDAGSSQVNNTINLPIAFSNQKYVVFCSGIPVSSVYNHCCEWNGYSDNNKFVVTRSYSSRYINWYAIGY